MGTQTSRVRLTVMIAIPPKGPYPRIHPGRVHRLPGVGVTRSFQVGQLRWPTWNELLTPRGAPAAHTRATRVYTNIR